jgi:hypothetical protein
MYTDYSDLVIGILVAIGLVLLVVTLPLILGSIYKKLGTGLTGTILTLLIMLIRIVPLALANDNSYILAAVDFWIRPNLLTAMTVFVSLSFCCIIYFQR